jgi:hypothetical protein
MRSRSDDTSRDASKEVDPDRRRFCGAAAMTVAAAQLGMFGSAYAQSRTSSAAGAPPGKAGAHTSLSAIKQIDAGVLNVTFTATWTWRLRWRRRATG